MRADVLLSFSAVLALLCLPAQSAVMGFDDITAAGEGRIATGYMGYDWGDGFFVYSNASYSRNYGNSYGAISGDYAALNGRGRFLVSMAGEGSFNFGGAYFTGWGAFDSANIYTSTQITVEGYRDGVLVGSASMPLSASRYDFLDASFIGIDSIGFISSGDCRWWLMDDLVLTPTSVPVPPAILLFFSSLLVLMGFGYPRSLRSMAKPACAGR